MLQDNFINIKNIPTNSKVFIYDLTGRMIHKSSNYNNDYANIKAPTTKGIYIGKVESQEGIQTIKFLIP